MMDTPDLATLTLDVGKHAGPEAGGCAMEWVSAFAGEPWSDNPACTSPVIAAYVRGLNDEMGDAERQRLVPYIPRLVGTTASGDVEQRRAYMAADTAVRVFAAAGLRAAGMTEQADLLAGLPEIVDEATAESAAGSTRSAARSAWAAAGSTWAAARSAESATRSAESATEAVRAAEAARSAAPVLDEALRLLDRLIEADA